MPARLPLSSDWWLWREGRVTDSRVGLWKLLGGREDIMKWTLSLTQPHKIGS